VDLVNVDNMEINKKHLIAYSILGVLVALFFGITIHQCSNPKVKYITSPPERIHDTIFRDSIQIREKEVVKYKTRDRITYDTIIERDTVKDTVNIQIPIYIEHKSYRDFQVTDTSNWELQIDYSGIQYENHHPSIDNVQFKYSYIPKETIIPKENALRQFVGISINAGYGATINTTDKTFIPGPYIGVGVSYGWGWTFK
jgi:hypothetical protein